ncbi:MAG: hypothetical protein IJF37_06600 [Lachnospiraceae bacterium]|nr:hypothetical protein [Lachnospiraceae bacterium]
MVLLAGQIFTADSRTLIYESGDEVETISYVAKGSVTIDRPSGSQTVAAGNFVAFEDIYSGFYSGNYTAEAGTQLLPIIAESPDSLVQFLNSNQALHDKIAIAVCKLIVQIHDIYQNLYNYTADFYSTMESIHDRYRECCREFSVKPENFIMPNGSEDYSFETQDFAKNYNIIASLATAPAKAEAVYKANGVKFLRIQTMLIKNIYTAFDDLAFYMRSLVSMLVGKGDNCLFAIVAKLCKRTKKANSIMFLLEDMKITVSNLDSSIQQHTGIALDIDYNRVDLFFNMASDTDEDDMYANAMDDELDLDLDFDLDYSPYDNDAAESTEASEEDDDYYSEMPDLSNTLKQLCMFAELNNRYDEYNQYIERFIALPDKESRDDNVRMFRKQFTAAYYELYEEVFVHYARSGERNRIVEIFLDFGLLDERLLTDAQLEFICTIPPLNHTKPCKVYRMKDWLMRIYKGEEIPSKNEFDMEYVDYVRDRKKNEALSPEKERQLLSDNELKVRYEIQNMLKYNCRLLNGNLLSFFPMLHMGNFERGIEDMLLTSELVNEQVTALTSLDYSIFYREMLYADIEKKIEKESIQKEIYPIFVLFPVAGVNSIMWQEISGKRSNSEGRIFLPSFFEGKMEDTFLNLFAKYHWELCKSIQGGAWNNIAVPSLTSEYSDYIQFYRKNKELSPEKKEALKNQMSRCRNNMREIFAFDFVIWMKYESAGSIRLNKVARRILATYCPFSKAVRDRLSSQPIFDEAMNKYNREKQKKVKELGLRYKALEKKGAEFTQELLDTQRFYEEL